LVFSSRYALKKKTPPTLCITVRNIPVQPSSLFFAGTALPPSFAPMLEQIVGNLIGMNAQVHVPAGPVRAFGF